MESWASTTHRNYTKLPLDTANLFLQIGRFYSYLHPPNKYLAPTQGQSNGSALSAGGQHSLGARARQYHSRQRQGQQEMSVTLLTSLVQCHILPPSTSDPDGLFVRDTNHWS